MKAREKPRENPKYLIETKIANEAKTLLAESKEIAKKAGNGGESLTRNILDKLHRADVFSRAFSLLETACNELEKVPFEVLALYDALKHPESLRDNPKAKRARAARMEARAIIEGKAGSLTTTERAKMWDVSERAAGRYLKEDKEFKAIIRTELELEDWRNERIRQRQKLYVAYTGKQNLRKKTPSMDLQEVVTKALRESGVPCDAE